jgi:hypothetical protein
MCIGLNPDTGVENFVLTEAEETTIYESTSLFEADPVYSRTVTVTQTGVDTSTAEHKRGTCLVTSDGTIYIGLSTLHKADDSSNSQITLTGAYATPDLTI